MIEWGSLVKTLGYDSEAAMWEDLYLKKGLSFSQMSRKLDVSRNVIREALIRAGIPSKKRGGPNNAHVEMPDELLDEIRKDGVAAVAKRLGVRYPTLYKRLRKRGLSVRILKGETIPADSPEETSGEGP